LASEEFKAEVRRELAGKNLACWCPLNKHCHADLLLELANEPAVSPKVAMGAAIIKSGDDGPSTITENVEGGLQ